MTPKFQFITYNKYDVEKYDMLGAIVLYYLASWMVSNKYSKKRHDKSYREGRYWVYRSRSKMVDDLNISEESLRRHINNFVNEGILIVDNFNEHGYDKTCWYTFRDLNYFAAWENELISKWGVEKIEEPPRMVRGRSPHGEGDNTLYNHNISSLSKDKEQDETSSSGVNFEDYDNAGILKDLIDIWADIDGAMSLQLRKTKTFDATIKALQKALKKHDPEDMAVCMHAYGKIYKLKGSTLSRKTKMSLLQFLTIRDEHQRIYMHNLGIPEGMTWLEICGMEWEYLRGKFSKMRQDRFPEITKVIREQWKRSPFYTGEITDGDENNFRLAAIRLEQYFYDRVYDADLNFHHGEDDNPVKFAYVFMKALLETCKDSKIPVKSSWLISDTMFSKRLEDYLEIKGHTKRG